MEGEKGRVFHRYTAHLSRNDYTFHSCQRYDFTNYMIPCFLMFSRRLAKRIM